MKAETKSKRRVTLSIAGLGWLDEMELDTIRGAGLAQDAMDPADIVPHPLQEGERPSPSLAVSQHPTADDIPYSKARQLLWQARRQPEPALAS